MARLAVHLPQESLSPLLDSGGFGIFEIGFAGIFFGAGFSLALAMARSTVQSPQESSSSLSGSGRFGIFEIGFAGILFGAGFSKALAFGAGVQSPQDSSSSLSESEGSSDILCLLCKKHCVL